MLWVVLIVIIALSAYYHHIKKLKLIKARDAALFEKHPNAKVYVSKADHSYCVIDFDRSKVLVGLNWPRGDKHHLEAEYHAEYPFSDIASVKVVQDGVAVSSSTRQDRVREMVLMLMVRDTEKPVHTVCFFRSRSEKGVQSSDPLLKQAVSEIETFSAHVSNAVFAAGAEKTENHALAGHPPVRRIG